MKFKPGIFIIFIYFLLLFIFNPFIYFSFPACYAEEQNPKSYALQKNSPEQKELYFFAKPEQKQQFYELAGNLRCLVCQNESLLDSNAPLAVDLRQQIIKQIQEGYSTKEIQAYLLKRYGDFILYQPRFTKQNIILWLAPAALLMLALIFTLKRVYKASRNLAAVSHLKEVS